MRKDELMHYGVKGMHWGVRRYQNADGSRTAAGKAHEKAIRGKSNSTSLAVYNDAYARRQQQSANERAYHIKKRIQNDNDLKALAISTDRLYNRTQHHKASKTNQQHLEDAKKMSDAELRARVNRMRTENEYVKLTQAQTHQAKSFTQNALRTLADVNLALWSASNLYNRLRVAGGVGSVGSVKTSSKRVEKRTSAMEANQKKYAKRERRANKRYEQANKRASKEGQRLTSVQYKNGKSARKDQARLVKAQAKLARDQYQEARRQHADPETLSTLKANYQYYKKLSKK